MRLPNLSKLTDTGTNDAKRAKPGLLPCQRELVYQQGEFVNVDGFDKVGGHDSLFQREPVSGLTLDSFSLRGAVSKEEVETFARSDEADRNVRRVVEEMYRTDGFDATSRVRNDELDVFTTTYSNLRAPQYHLKTLTQPSTVIHVNNTGHFWIPDPTQVDRPTQLEDIKEQSAAYTAGFIWTSTHPNWSWESKPHGIIMRYKIQLPIGMQVIVDRAPAVVQYCETPDGRRSAFPDVLIPPSKFKVVSVERYSSGAKHQSQQPPERPRKNSEWSQEQYVSHMLEDNSLFVDVTLEVESFWNVPVPN